MNPQTSSLATTGASSVASRHEMCTHFTARGRVASTYLCKFEERFSFPGPVQVTDDAVDDAVAAFHIGEARHGARSSAHFTEGALDDVGGAHLDPVLLRDGEKV